VLNWAPARLTAALIALGRGGAQAWTAARAEGPLHRSVNAGWPEAAMARTLDLSLSGPRSYGGETTGDPMLNPTGRRDATPGDIDAACGVLWRVWALLLTGAALIALATTLAG
jgi:adenosylcobinamide-phosphate synthase